MRRKLRKFEKENRDIAQKLWAKISPPQPSRKLSPSGSGTKSWAEEIEEEQMQRPKEKSMWDTFDIAKLSNDGFKLDYVAPEKW